MWKELLSRPRIHNIAPREITSLIDLFKLLANSNALDGHVNLFRGHSDRAYTLKPSVLRKAEYGRNEKNILRELIAIQPKEFLEDQTAFERLVRVQHYGLPTRLLDLTYNPLVGLFFSCLENEDKDGEFLRLTLKQSKIKYFDSDTVSCIANLSNLTVRERNEIRRFTRSQQFNESEVGMRFLHFIKAEKPYFLPLIRLPDLANILAVRPKQNNQRILAQQGAFLIFGLKSVLRDSNSFGIQVFRTKVPASKKKLLLKELDGININRSTLFPEIESAAEYIMNKITPINEPDEEQD